MSLPTSTASGSTAGTAAGSQHWAGPDGWYFIQFLDGSVALAYLKNHIWQWSKGGAPPKNVGPATPYFLGTGSNVASASGAKQLSGLLGHYANAHQASIIMGAIDAGIGKSAWAPKSGAGRGFKFGSDAAPVQNPYDVVANAAAKVAGAVTSPFSFLDFLGSGTFWAGLGMSLAGAALVAFGVFQLAGVGKTTAIRVLK